jgi:SAM-dependent methyltransferase
MTALLGELLRLGRTAGLRLAGPADYAYRLLAGKADLPPLWLRRHAGAPSKFESAARDTAEFLDRLGVLEPTDDILDVGCGAGSMAAELAKRIGPGRRYVGFDVHGPSIRWCQRRFAGDPRLSFHLAAIASPYGVRSGAPAASYRFPMEDGRAGFILAKSVFTHLLEPEVRHYLREIRRTLMPGRGAVLTAFLFDRCAPQAGPARRAFPFADSSGNVRWRSRLRPTAAVAYDRIFFESLVAEAGIRVQWVSPGYFPGGPRLTGQDIVLLGH